MLFFLTNYVKIGIDVVVMNDNYMVVPFTSKLFHLVLRLLWMTTIWCLLQSKLFYLVLGLLWMTTITQLYGVFYNQTFPFGIEIVVNDNYMVPFTSRLIWFTHFFLVLIWILVDKKSPIHIDKLCFVLVFFTLSIV